jgi:hypothetical protein
LDLVSFESYWCCFYPRPYKSDTQIQTNTTHWAFASNYYKSRIIWPPHRQQPKS